MGPKRKMSDSGSEDVTAPKTKTAKTKAQVAAKKGAEHWASKKEKARDAIDRLVAAGQEWSKANEAETPIDKAERESLDLDWVERGAQYLVREDRFHAMMQNPPQLESIELMHTFLAAIHFPRRWKRHDKWSSFHEWQLQHSRQIIVRAREIWFDVIGTSQTMIHDTKLQPPGNSPAEFDLRKALFAQHTLRQTTITAIKACVDLEHQIMRKVTMRDTTTGSASIASTVEELNLIEDCKLELRAKLRGSPTIVRGRKLLDDLLEASDSEKNPNDKVQNLCHLPDNCLDKDMQFKREEPSIDSDAIRQAIDKVHRDPGLDFDDDDPGQYYSTNRRGESRHDSVIRVRSPRKWPEIDVPADEMPDMRMESISGAMTASERDQRLVEELETTFAAVDIPRYKANLSYFENILSRPSKIANAQNGGAITGFTAFWGNPSNWEYVVFDNVFYVRWFADQLRRADLLKDDQATQQCLRRMWGVLALYYGCVREGGLLLELMDALLEDLAEQINGNTDALYQTETMVKLQKFHETGDLDKAVNMDFGDEFLDQLERKDKARGVFNELARFYHGAVIMAYADISWGSSNYDKSHNWYKQLLRYCLECPADACSEPLKIFENQNQRNQKWGLSVGVKDGRKGFPENRPSFDVHNREFAYPCLYDIIAFRRWHDGHGVFFHYFAHFYHPACKHSRGKTALVTSVNASATV